MNRHYPGLESSYGLCGWIIITINNNNKNYRTHDWLYNFSSHYSLSSEFFLFFKTQLGTMWVLIIRLLNLGMCLVTESSLIIIIIIVVVTNKKPLIKNGINMQMHYRITNSEMEAKIIETEHAFTCKPTWSFWIIFSNPPCFNTETRLKRGRDF